MTNNFFFKRQSCERHQLYILHGCNIDEIQQHEWKWQDTLCQHGMMKNCHVYKIWLLRVNFHMDKTNNLSFFQNFIYFMNFIFFKGSTMRLSYEEWNYSDFNLK